MTKIAYLLIISAIALTMAENGQAWHRPEAEVLEVFESLPPLAMEARAFTEQENRTMKQSKRSSAVATNSKKTNKLPNQLKRN